MPQLLADRETYVRTEATRIFQGCSRQDLEGLYWFLLSETEDSFEGHQVSAEYILDDEDEPVALEISCDRSEEMLEFDWLNQSDIAEAQCLIDILSEWLAA